jgi:hypothetical protein
MNAQELWESHTFHTLLSDIFKARKNSELGPMRLQVLMDWILAQNGNGSVPKINPIKNQLELHPITEGEKQELLVTHSDDFTRKASQLEEVATIIKKCFDKTGWNDEGTLTCPINASRSFDHNFLESYLKKEKGMQFSGLRVAISPGEFGSDQETKKFWLITLNK